MTSVADIKEAVDNLIRSDIRIDVMSSNVEDDYTTPVFITQIISISDEAITTSLNRNNRRVRIFYYPEKEKDEVDMLNMLSTLQSIFRLTLPVKERVFTIDESSYDINVDDGFLMFTFKFEYTERFAPKEFEKMKSIEIDRRS